MASPYIKTRSRFYSHNPFHSFAIIFHPRAIELLCPLRYGKEVIAAGYSISTLGVCRSKESTVSCEAQSSPKNNYISPRIPPSSSILQIYKSPTESFLPTTLDTNKFSNHVGFGRAERVRSYDRQKTIHIIFIQEKRKRRIHTSFFVLNIINTKVICFFSGDCANFYIPNSPDAFRCKYRTQRCYS